MYSGALHLSQQIHNKRRSLFNHQLNRGVDERPHVVANSKKNQRGRIRVKDKSLHYTVITICVFCSKTSRFKRQQITRLMPDNW